MHTVTQSDPYVKRIARELNFHLHERIGRRKRASGKKKQKKNPGGKKDNLFIKIGGKEIF